jgi:hypothetical protein
MRLWLNLAGIGAVPLGRGRGRMALALQTRIRSVGIDPQSSTGPATTMLSLGERDSDHPWWRDLFARLCAFADDLTWRYEPGNDVLIARRLLSIGEQRDLRERLTQRPDAFAEHVALHRTIKNLSNEREPITIVFFRDAPTSETRAEHR